MIKKKILVVDDEADFINLVKTRLEAANYDVVVAYDGKEALGKIKSEKPDAVLLDVMIPGIDGLNVLKKIRKENKALPIFIVTAFSDKEKFELARKLGASGFIVKTDDLKKEIENITSSLGLSEKYKGV